jgi:hypothetical protein
MPDAGSRIGELQSLRRRAEAGIQGRLNHISDLERQIVELKSELKRIRQAGSLLSDLQHEAEVGHWCEVVRIVDRSKDLKTTLDEFAPGTSAEVFGLREYAAKRAEPLVAEFSSRFPKAMEERGEPLENSSRYPIFKLRSGFFEIKVNKAKFEIAIGIRHGSTVKASADVDHAVDAALREVRRCFGAETPIQEFVERLRSAYQNLSGSNTGRPFSLEEVRRAFKEKIPPRDEFSVYLSRVLREQPEAGQGMNLDHTKVIETGFLLPGFEDRGYFGAISFS